MLYSCTHVATVGVKGLNKEALVFCAIWCKFASIFSVQKTLHRPSYKRLETDLITLVARSVDSVVRLDTIYDDRQLLVIVFLPHRHVHVVQKLLHVLDLRSSTHGGP